MYPRLALGFIIIIFSYSLVNSYRMIIVALIILGVLTDIFDGIIAGKLNISSHWLRRMDSSIDHVFWICALRNYSNNPAHLLLIIKNNNCSYLFM